MRAVGAIVADGWHGIDFDHMRAIELAASLGVTLEGDDVELTAAAPLETATAAELSFVANAKAAAGAAESGAGCLIVPLEFPAGRTVIRSANPRAAFAQALTLLYPAPPRAGIHPTAIIDETAEVAPGVEIGAYTVVGARCRIGEGATLHSRVTLYADVSVGARTIIHSGAVLGADGFGFQWTGEQYRKFPQVGRVEIGSDVEIGANCTIDRAALGVTRIGDGTKLDNMVHIAHNCQLGRHVVIAAQTGMAGGCTVGDRAVIGGQVGFGEKVRVEPGAIIGSGAGILSNKIVRAGEPVWGTPARPLRRYLRDLGEVSRLSTLREQVAALKRPEPRP